MQLSSLMKCFLFKGGLRRRCIRVGEHALSSWDFCIKGMESAAEQFDTMKLDSLILRASGLRRGDYREVWRPACVNPKWVGAGAGVWTSSYVKACSYLWSLSVQIKNRFTLSSTAASLAAPFPRFSTASPKEPPGLGSREISLTNSPFVVNSTSSLG